MAGMQFTFKVSEAEYLRAWRLQFKPRGSRAVKTVIFWVFILVCLLLLWAVVERSASTPQGTGEPATTQQQAVPPPSSSASTHALLVNVGPFVLLVCVWAFMLRFGQLAPHRLYRRDPLMQGEYTVNITPESISTLNSAGTSTKSTWNVFASWREEKDLILLLYFNGAYFILGLSGLSEPQRSELRGILTAALPKK
jgi:hypothetical protein